MKIIKIGIAAQDEMRERILAIAKGDLKIDPSDPKIWFVSNESLTEALWSGNKDLLNHMNVISNNV